MFIFAAENVEEEIVVPASNLTSPANFADVITSDGLEIISSSFAALADTIRQSANGRSIVLMRNDGNYGDALIHHGTKTFLNDLGIPWTQLDMASRVDKAKAIILGLTSSMKNYPPLLVYSGGGGWASACNVALVNVQRQLRFSSDMIVLPSTIERRIEHMPRIFVRDVFQSQKTVPDAPFCHDMAFYLALVGPDRLLANRVSASRPVGLVFRTDNEARVGGVAAHPANVDISTWGTTGTDITGFLRHLDQFEHVVTDRLHAAIGAALLGKRVSLVPGSYFKIEAIFRSSIEGIFPKCELISDDEAKKLAASVPSPAT